MKLETRLKKLEDYTKLINSSDPILQPNEELVQCFLEVFNDYLSTDHKWHVLNDDTKYELTKTFMSRLRHNGSLPINDKRQYEKLLPDEYMFMEKDLTKSVINAVKNVESKGSLLQKLDNHHINIVDRNSRGVIYNREPNSKNFAELVLKDDITGRRINLEQIHIEWHNFIDKCLSMGKRRIGIMSPFEHGKTTWCLGMALKYLVDDPSTRITFVCNSDDNAIKRVSTLGSYIDEDKDFKTFFGDRVKRDQKRSWTDHKLYLERHTRAIDPSIEARGLTTKGAGSRIDVLILDDICDIDDTYSEAKRKKGIAQLRGLWLHRVTQHGIAICIATAYHQEDAVHWLVDNPEWCFLIQRISENFKEIEQIEVIR